MAAARSAIATHANGHSGGVSKPLLVESPRNVHIDIATHPSADGKTEITTYKIHNPLAKRHWEQILKDIEGHLRAEIEAWRDAKMKQILPEWCYSSVHSGVKERAKEVWDYMSKERIEIVHPDGLSLERQIWVKGQPVAIFTIELANE